jgi:uncharacterized protein (DUF1501 family)
LPSFVSVGGTASRIGPGFLGMTYAPFTVQNPGQPPENVSPPRDVNMARRVELFRAVEGDFLKSRGNSAEAAKAHRDIYEKAFGLSVGSAGRAFNLDDERANFEKYGNNNFGRGCLLARKLVDKGAVCVEVDLGGWDTHQNNFRQLADQRLPTLDKAMAALVEDLVQRGMWKNTVVLWMGEFGRTPRINQNAGRDHWARCWSVVLGGGAIKGGQAYGSTNSDGTAVKDNEVKIGDLFATVYQAMGLDPNTQVRDNLGRPSGIAGDNAKPITALLG